MLATVVAITLLGKYDLSKARRIAFPTALATAVPLLDNSSGSSGIPEWSALDHDDSFPLLAVLALALLIEMQALFFARAQWLWLRACHVIVWLPCGCVVAMWLCGCHVVASTPSPSHYTHTTLHHHTTTPHHTTPYHTIQHFTTPCHVIPPHTTPYHSTPYHAMPHHTILYRTTPYHTLPHSTLSYHTIPYHAIPHHTCCNLPHPTPPYYAIHQTRTHRG